MADSHQATDPKRPDLEESTNVAEAHASLLETGAAQAREKRIQESGMEPVSLWVFLASAVVLLVGGTVMGAGGRLFNYDPMPEGYVRAEFEGAGDSGPVTDTILNAMMRRGAKTYSAKCVGCHKPDGLGDGAEFPPLANSEWVTGSTERLAMIILNGLDGKITVNGQSWEKNMSPPGITDKADLASVMTYVRNSFGNATGDVVTFEQAGNAIEINSKRPIGQINAQELDANHDKMLGGEPIPAATVVDVETMEPVEVSAEAAK